MKDFYVFLDVDGVLYDWDYIFSEVKAGNIKKGGMITTFKKDSIEALNHLIEITSKTYNTKLVITSSFRKNMNLLISKLKESGLAYDGEIDRIGNNYSSINRGKEIKYYLKDKSNYDFLIIDDEMFDYKEEFEKFDIIKTEIYHNALSLEMVKKYLSEKKNKTL